MNNDAQPKPDAVQLLRRYSNAHFVSAADEHREGASDAGVTRRYDASEAAHAALMAEIKALMEDRTRLEKLEATMRRTLGAPSPERSISCDVHMGASIRAAIDQHLP